MISITNVHNNYYASLMETTYECMMYTKGLDNYKLDDLFQFIY